MSAARALSPKPRPIDDAAGDRQHVLDRAADLGADQIVRRDRAGTSRLPSAAMSRWPSAASASQASPRSAGRAPPRRRRSGPTAPRAGAPARSRATTSLISAPVFDLDALGADDDRRACGASARPRRHGAQILRRHREQHGIGARRLGEIGRGAQARIERDARQEERVLMRGLIAATVSASRAHSTISRPARAQHLRQRRAPGAAAENEEPIYACPMVATAARGVMP